MSAWLVVSFGGRLARFAAASGVQLVSFRQSLVFLRASWALRSSKARKLVTSFGCWSHSVNTKSSNSTLQRPSSCRRASKGWRHIDTTRLGLFAPNPPGQTLRRRSSFSGEKGRWHLLPFCIPLLYCSTLSSPLLLCWPSLIAVSCFYFVAVAANLLRWI